MEISKKMTTGEGLDKLMYEMTVIDIDCDEGMHYTTYGIRAVDSSGNVAVAYADVSTKKALVEDIVEKCNRFEASPIHLEDILMDFLE